MATGWDASLVDAFTWAEKNDYKRAQEKAFGFSSTVAAIKGDITLLKAEIAGLALFSAGAAAVKFDYTLFKVDEKGVSWRGRQIYATKYADDVKHFQTKLDQTNRNFSKTVTKFDLARKEQDRKLVELQGARQRLETARSIQDPAARANAQARSGTDLRSAEVAYEKAQKKYAELRGQVGTLTHRVQTLTSKIKEVKPDEQFKAAVKGLRDFEEALAEAAEAASK